MGVKVANNATTIVAWHGNVPVVRQIIAALAV
jgi:hypothetical protein